MDIEDLLMNKEKVMVAIKHMSGGIPGSTFFSKIFNVSLTNPVKFNEQISFDMKYFFVQNHPFPSFVYIQKVFKKISTKLSNQYDLIKANLIISTPDPVNFHQHLHSVLPPDDAILGKLGYSVLICFV
jgi:hypothetical protein